MSILNVASLKHESALVDNLVLDSSGNTTFAGAATVGSIVLPSGGSLAVKDSSNVDTYIGVDSAGRVTKPYQPAFTAFNGSDPAPTASSVYIFTNTELNRGNYYSTSTGRFTCPVNGVYVFHYRWLTTAGVTAQPRLFKNGVSIDGATGYGNPATGEYFTGTISVALNCNANDYITCGALSGTILIGPNYNSGFSGYLLG